MGLEKMFNLPEALAHLDRMKQSKNNIRRLTQKNALFCVTKIKRLQSVLPESELRNEVIQALRKERSVRIDQIRLRPNRELVEFHLHDDYCVCDELMHVFNENFLHQIQAGIKTLDSYRLLLKVEVDHKGLPALSSCRKNLSPQRRPYYGIGTGFRIYGTNYHISKK